MGKEIEMLENHTHFLSVEIDIGLFVGNVHSLKENLSGGGNLQQIEAAQKGEEL